MTTLDQAQEAFHANKVAATAQTYLDTVIAYWQDEMIGDNTFGEAKKELREWCNNTNSTLVDPRTLAIWHT